MVGGHLFCFLYNKKKRGLGLNMEVRKKIAALTQEELAEAMEVSRQTVYKWEHDLANPELSKLEKLIKTLNISFDDLLK